VDKLNFIYISLYIAACFKLREMQLLVNLKKYVKEDNIKTIH